MVIAGGSMPRLTDGLYFIPGQDEFLPDCHVYVLGDPSTHDLSLVDVGLVGKGNDKIRCLGEIGIELKDIKRIIMTHTHLDHVGCLREILQAIPWAELWIQALEAEPLENGDERTVYGMDMFRELCEVQYALKPDQFRFHVNRKLAGGESLHIGGMLWDVIHIPGHSMGSIGLYQKTKGILIPGDVIYADHAIGRFDLHGANASELRESLMRLADLKVDVLLPGHNRIVHGLAPGYILATVKQWEPHLG
jgi:glyoxylase-like metal-dependent hydrolase (beta-lactamase superfamily II)